MNRTKWAIPAYVGAVLVAVSRLFLFVHYPTDVICGALLGVLFGVLGSLAAGAIYDRVCANIAASKNNPPERQWRIAYVRNCRIYRNA